MTLAAEQIRKVDQTSRSQVKTITQETPPPKEMPDPAIKRLEDEIRKLNASLWALSPTVPKLWCPYCREK